MIFMDKNIFLHICRCSLNWTICIISVDIFSGRVVSPFNCRLELQTSYKNDMAAYANKYVSTLNVSEDGGRGQGGQCGNHWWLMKQCHALNGSELRVSPNGLSWTQDCIPVHCRTDIQDQSGADTIQWRKVVLGDLGWQHKFDKLTPLCHGCCIKRGDRRTYSDLSFYLWKVVHSR